MDSVEILGIVVCTRLCRACCSCQCITIRLHQRWEFTDIAFVGTVVATDGDYTILHVSQAFRGGPETFVRVRILSQGKFDVGEQYLVFAIREEDRCRTTGCRAAPVSKSGRDLAMLRHRGCLWRLEDRFRRPLRK